MPFKAPVKKKAPQRHGSAKRRMPRRSSAASIRALAAALGRSEAACRKWTSRADWPFGPPPWPVDRVREWTAIALSPDPAAALRARLANAEGGAAGNAPAGSSLWAKRSQAELLRIFGEDAAAGSTVRRKGRQTP
jgi:hypothetical protein